MRRHLPKMTPIGAIASPAERPAPATHAPGLFVAGDWIGGEGWLDRRGDGVGRRRGPRRPRDPRPRPSPREGRRLRRPPRAPLRDRLRHARRPRGGGGPVQDAWLRFVRPTRAPPRNAEAFLVTVTTRLASTGCAQRARPARDLRRAVAARADRRRPRAAGPRRHRRRGRAAQPRAAHRARAPQPGRARRARCCATSSTSSTPRSPTPSSRTPANCRQIAARAREHAGEPARRRPVDRRGGAARHAPSSPPSSPATSPRSPSVLAADANTYSDGGGVVPAARKVDLRRGEAARLLIGLRRKLGTDRR